MNRTRWRPVDPKYMYPITTHQFFKGTGTCAVSKCIAQADVICLPLDAHTEPSALCNTHFDKRVEAGSNDVFIEIEELCPFCGRKTEVIFAFQNGEIISSWNSCLGCQRQILQSYVTDFQKRLKDVDVQTRSKNKTKERKK